MAKTIEQVEKYLKSRKKKLTLDFHQPSKASDIIYYEGALVEVSKIIQWLESDE